MSWEYKFWKLGLDQEFISWTNQSPTLVLPGYDMTIEKGKLTANIITNKVFRCTHPGQDQPADAK